MINSASSTLLYKGLPTVEEHAQQTATAEPAGTPLAPETLELTATPHPFLDWSLIQVGGVNWVGEQGEDVRLRAAMMTQDDNLRPMFACTPTGVRIRLQPPNHGGPIFHDVAAWESGLRPGSSAFFDEDIYRLWYYSAAGQVYAQSADGIDWTRPMVDFVAYDRFSSTNLMPPVDKAGNRRLALHEGAIFKDPSCGQEARYKAVFPGHISADECMKFSIELGQPIVPAMKQRQRALFAAISPDGFCWEMLPRPIILNAGDTQSVVYFDHELERYVGYFRCNHHGRRGIARAETFDFARWPHPTPVLAPGPDEDPTVEFLGCGFSCYPDRPDIKLMFPTIYDTATDSTQVRAAVSRDGVIWHWMPGDPVLVPGCPESFDAGSVFAHAGLLRAADHRLTLFYTGCNRPYAFPKTAANINTLACAWWEEDRFAAIESPGRGEFTTVPMKFCGHQLLLNMQAERAGEIRVELRDAIGKAIPGHTFAESDPLIGDHRWQPITWSGQSDISEYQDQLLYLRFRMRAAKIYAIKARKTQG